MQSKLQVQLQLLLEVALLELLEGITGLLEAMFKFSEVPRYSIKVQGTNRKQAT